MFRYIPVICPVCKARLDRRLKAELCIVTCIECNVKWMFKPNQELPVPITDKKEDVCDCGGCQYRDNH